MELAGLLSVLKSTACRQTDGQTDTVCLSASDDVYVAPVRLPCADRSAIERSIAAIMTVVGGWAGDAGVDRFVVVVC